MPLTSNIDIDIIDYKKEDIIEEAGGWQNFIFLIDWFVNTGPGSLDSYALCVCVCVCVCAGARVWLRP